MNDYGLITEPHTVRFERVLPGPIERVWAYLTESEARGQWLAPGPMELRGGGRVELTFRNDDLSPHKAPTPERYRQYDEGASLYGRITQCEPPRLLSYTWGDGPEDESEVTFELSPHGGDAVRLVLTHRRLADRAEMLSVSGGWHTHLGILADRLAGRVPPNFWAVYAEREREYEQRLPPE